MNHRNMIRVWARRFDSTWAQCMILGVGLLLTGACGSRLQDKLGGETGFLLTCKSDGECQSGLCACGVCTRECTDENQCNGGRAMCASKLNGNQCAPAGQLVCLPADDMDTNVDNDASLTSDGTDGESTGVEEPCTRPFGHCDEEFLSTSPGQVEFRVEVRGATCPLGCGGHVLSLHTRVEREPIVTDMLQCGDECPLPPPPVCTEPSTEPLIWDGRVNVADGTQSCENLGGGSLPCEMESRYLPPGRYLVTVCLGLLDGLGCTESCRDQEFIFPSEQPVVVHWMNDSTVGFDTTGTAASPGDAGVPPWTEGLPTDPPRMGDGGIPSGSLWTGEMPAPTDDPTSRDASVL